MFGRNPLDVRQHVLTVLMTQRCERSDLPDRARFVAWRVVIPSRRAMPLRVTVGIVVAPRDSRNGRYTGKTLRCRLSVTCFASQS